MLFSERDSEILIERINCISFIIESEVSRLLKQKKTQQTFFRHRHRNLSITILHDKIMSFFHPIMTPLFLAGTLSN